MKKISLMLMLLVFMLPIIINADCNSSEHKKYLEYTKNITYDNEFSLSTKKYNVTIYNVISDVYVKYDNTEYKSNNSDTVIIENVPQGKIMQIEIYASDGCNTPLKYINIKQSYYNDFYGSDICKEYVDKVTYCTSRFTPVKASEELVKIAIKNYDNSIIQDPIQQVNNESKLSLREKIIDFLLNWGIKGLLFILTTIISYRYYSDKYMKIKHGI